MAASGPVTQPEPVLERSVRRSQRVYSTKPDNDIGRSEIAVYHTAQAALKPRTIRWLKPDPPTGLRKYLISYQTEQITASLRLQTAAFIKHQKPVTAANLLNMFDSLSSFIFLSLSHSEFVGYNWSYLLFIILLYHIYVDIYNSKVVDMFTFVLLSYIIHENINVYVTEKLK